MVKLIVLIIPCLEYSYIWKISWVDHVLSFLKNWLKVKLKISGGFGVILFMFRQDDILAVSASSISSLFRIGELRSRKPGNYLTPTVNWYLVHYFMSSLLFSQLHLSPYHTILWPKRLEIIYLLERTHSVLFIVNQPYNLTLYLLISISFLSYLHIYKTSVET